MNKGFVWGMLAGIVLGILLTVFYPKIASLDIVYNFFSRKQMLLPESEQFATGSVFVIGSFVPLVLGLFGGIVGLFVSKMRNNEVRRK